MPKKSGTFWKKVPCSLTGLALGSQSAVTAFLLFLSVFCTVFFQRSAPEVGNVTEKAEFCSGISSAAFCLGNGGIIGDIGLVGGWDLSIAETMGSYSLSSFMCLLCRLSGSLL